MTQVKTIITFLLFTLLFVSSSLAQVVGQIFTKAEAQHHYGRVLESVTIPAKNLQIILNKADEYVMFNIIAGQLFVLNSNREVLFPAGGEVKEDQVFYYFSKSIVEGLINFFEKKQTVEIELREKEDVLSITYGEFTLEVVILCPPMCP